jgi:conjugative transposon TraM protein
MVTDDVRNSEQLYASGDQSQKRKLEIRRLKMLLILPLLMLPFLTLAFWSLGGGKGLTDKGKTVGQKEGLNLDLPSPNIKNEGKEDKLTYYEKAEQQAGRDKEALQNDSLFALHGSDRDSNKLDNVVANSPSQYDPTPKDPYTGLNTSSVHSKAEVTEDQIMDRLKQLQQQNDKPQTTSASNDESPKIEDTDTGSDVDRLEGMMKMLQDKKGDDPEMQKLEGMLDKIMDIQHPDLVKERLKEQSMRQKTNAFPVYSKLSKGSSTLLTSDTEGKGAVVPNGFYSLNEQSAEGQRQNAVEAVVHETETLVDGSIVKLRLVNDIYVNGNLIPKGNFLFGQASLGGERLTIEINSIRYNNSIFPVQLEVYDLDGLAGIHVPGAITRDVAKQSADNSLQSLELTSLNPSLAAQATSAGVNTARSLLSRRVKLVKVTVKANYKVLLWNKGGNQ